MVCSYSGTSSRRARMDWPSLSCPISRYRSHQNDGSTGRPLLCCVLSHWDGGGTASRAHSAVAISVAPAIIATRSVSPA
eukprot:scaffold111786_cov63-Phaeocystis_antarctica.AAC.6